MASTTLRIRPESKRVLKSLAEMRGASMQHVLEQAIERYRRECFLEQANAAFAALRADTEQWGQELAERQQWDNALDDGLEGPQP